MALFHGHLAVSNCLPPCYILRVGACFGRHDSLAAPWRILHVDFHLHLSTEPVTHAHPVQPLIVEPDATIGQILQLLKEERRGAVLVCEGGQLRGIFTERDALGVMARKADLSAPISSVMARDMVTLVDSDVVGSAIERMAEGGFRRLPVVDEQNRPVGMIKVTGILHYLVEHFPTTIYTLPPRPHHSTQAREGA